MDMMVWRSLRSPCHRYMVSVRNKLVDMDKEVHGDVVGVETRLSGGGLKAFYLSKED